jgi:hypothetical protein
MKLRVHAIGISNLDAFVNGPTASLACSTTASASVGAVPPSLKALTTRSMSWFGSKTEYTNGRNVVHRKRTESASNMIA